MCKKCDEIPIFRILRQKICDMAAVEEQLEKHLVNLRSPCGRTPLMLAAYYGHKDAMERFIEKGAVVNAIDEVTGDTAAHFCVLSLTGHIRQCSCMMVLIEYGALIDMRNTDGFTVFELASKNGNYDIGNTGNAMMRGEEETKKPTDEAQ